MTLDQLNSLATPDFVDALNGIYEHSPWIPERAAVARPFTSSDALHAALKAVVDTASPDEQLSLLCAHPELAGKEAAAGTLTSHSTDEQKGAGLVNLSEDEKREIAALNQRYRERFGFPFIIAVKHHTRSSIFSELRRRSTGNDLDLERGECLSQVHEIARLRLLALLAA